MCVYVVFTSMLFLAYTSLSIVRHLFPQASGQRIEFLFGAFYYASALSRLVGRGVELVFELDQCQRQSSEMVEVLAQIIRKVNAQYQSVIQQYNALPVKIRISVPILQDSLLSLLLFAFIRPPCSRPCLHPFLPS